MTAWWLLPPLMAAGVTLLNWAIRRGLAAPRLVSTAVPEGLPWQEVAVPTANGKKLFGCFIPGPSRAPALVVMHGWGGNAQTMLPLAAPLHGAGYTLLFLDARCHGRSDADSFASLPRFAEDIEAGLVWLQRQPGIDPVAYGLIGHSVGAGAALLAGTRQSTVKAVVSLAAFAHPAGMMRRWLAAMRIPFWPLGAYILAYVQRVIGCRFDEIAPVRSIGRLSCPVLIVHGLADETVPFSEAQAIFAARATDLVELLAVPGSHDDYGDIELHLPAMLGFLATAFLPAVV